MLRVEPHRLFFRGDALHVGLGDARDDFPLAGWRNRCLFRSLLSRQSLALLSKFLLFLESLRGLARPLLFRKALRRGRCFGEMRLARGLFCSNAAGLHRRQLPQRSVNLCAHRDDCVTELFLNFSRSAHRRQHRAPKKDPAPISVGREQCITISFKTGPHRRLFAESLRRGRDAPLACVLLVRADEPPPHRITSEDAGNGGPTGGG